jgi:hypothetical protein
VQYDACSLCITGVGKHSDFKFGLPMARSGKIKWGVDWPDDAISPSHFIDACRDVVPKNLRIPGGHFVWGKEGSCTKGRCVRQWKWRIFIEAKRFSGSIIGIPEIACPIGSKFSAVLCRYGHQQVRDAQVWWLANSRSRVCIFLLHPGYI